MSKKSCIGHRAVDQRRLSSTDDILRFQQFPKVYSLHITYVLSNLWEVCGNGLGAFLLEDVYNLM